MHFWHYAEQVYLYNRDKQLLNICHLGYRGIHRLTLSFVYYIAYQTGQLS